MLGGASGMAGSGVRCIGVGLVGEMGTVWNGVINVIEITLGLCRVIQP